MGWLRVLLRLLWQPCHGAFPRPGQLRREASSNQDAADAWRGVIARF